MFICRWCKNNDFITLWDLGDAPYGDLFQESLSLSKSISKKSFVLVECNLCELLQLRDRTDIESQYNNYLYKSNVTFGLSNAYLENSDFLINQFLTPNSKIIDIGSNDGSFLKYFKQKGYWVLGIEPAKSASEHANSLGINTINAYFSSKLVDTELAELVNQIDLISVNYTLANIEDLSDFLTGISTLLKSDGILSITTGYHPDQFTVSMFDYIGHDHLTYFSLRNLVNILASMNFHLVEIKKSELKGGSISLVAQKGYKKYSQPKYDYLIQRENWLWPNNRDGILQLTTRIDSAKKIVQEELKKFDYKIIGLGASISTTYLINYFDIHEKFEFLVDDDIAKIGKFSPFYGHKVISFSEAKNIGGSKFCVLAWQHTNQLIKRFYENDLKGSILIPLPNPHWI